MTGHRLRRVLLTTMVMLAVGGGAAQAHIEPSVDKYKAGSTAAVSFTVTHGCNGSPTTKLVMRLPATVTAPAPMAPNGWKTAVSADKRLVTWLGGSLPATRHGVFAVKMTFPNSPGTILSFPIVQTCKVGLTRWAGTSEKDEHPAPVITLTKQRRPTK